MAKTLTVQYSSDKSKILMKTNHSNTVNYYYANDTASELFYDLQQYSNDGYQIIFK